MVDDLAPWRSPLSHALHRNRSLPNARYFQLATVQRNGKPANRTVVFRGFSAQGQIQVVTDQRSEKMAHIGEHPWGEICWYFPKTREQFRITVSIEMLDAACTDTARQSLRCRLWQALSDSARTQFAWPCPGREQFAQSEFDVLPPSDDQPLPQFVVLLLMPHHVDHLELRGDPQSRRVYDLTDHQTWRVRSVNP